MCQRGNETIGSERSGRLELHYQLGGMCAKQIQKSVRENVAVTLSDDICCSPYGAYQRQTKCIPPTTPMPFTTPLLSAITTT